MEATRKYLSTMSKILQSVSDNDNLNYDMLSNTKERFDSLNQLMYVNFIQDTVLAAIEDIELNITEVEDHIFTAHLKVGENCRHYKIAAYTFGGEIELTAFTCPLEYTELANVGFIEKEDFEDKCVDVREYSNSRTVTKLIQKIKEDRKKLARPVDDTTKEYKLVITTYEYRTNQYMPKQFKKMELYKLPETNDPIAVAWNEKAKEYRNEHVYAKGFTTCMVPEQPQTFKTYLQFLKEHKIKKNIADVQYVDNTGRWV